MHDLCKQPVPAFDSHFDNTFPRAGLNSERLYLFRVELVRVDPVERKIRIFRSDVWSEEFGSDRIYTTFVLFGSVHPIA